MRAVVRTRVGYAGGTKKNPTYHSLGDHTETLQMDYDPLRISYSQLLDVFWESHDATSRPWSRQYTSLIFYHTPEQHAEAQASKERVEATLKRKTFTEIVPAAEFYLAEGYHQKYWLRQVPELMKEFRVMYRSETEFVNSTAAARVNGYVAGYGTLETLQQELGSFGLSAAANSKLMDIVMRHSGRQYATAQW